MARSFAAASSQYLRIPSTYVPWGSMSNLTLHIKINLPNFTGAYRIVAMDDGTTTVGIVSYPTTGVIGLHAGGTSGDMLGATMTVNQWMNVTGCWVPTAATNASRKIYCNTTKYTTNSATFARSGTDSQINICRRLSPLVYVDARVADFAAWDVQLTDDECVSLGRGISPALIRPASLKLYAPLIGSLIDVRNGVAISSSGSPGVYAHPRVYN